MASFNSWYDAGRGVDRRRRLHRDAALLVAEVGLPGGPQPGYIASGARREALGADLNRVLDLSGVKVETSQVNIQQDGKLVS
jgi:hypothetical protein